MKSNVSAFGNCVGSQASKPSWISHAMQGMPRASHTSRAVPLPVMGSNTMPGRKKVSRSLMSLPPQLPGHLRSPYSPPGGSDRGWSGAAPGWQCSGHGEAGVVGGTGGECLHGCHSPSGAR